MSPHYGEPLSGTLMVELMDKVVPLFTAQQLETKLEMIAWCYQKSDEEIKRRWGELEDEVRNGN